MVLSLDVDYFEEPLIEVLVTNYNVTNTPTLIINDEIKIEEVISANELKKIIESY